MRKKAIKIKNEAKKELEEVRKDVEGRKMNLDQLESHLTSLPNFHRIIYKSQEKACLEAYIGHITLKFYVKCGIISIDNQVSVWGEDGIGFIGTFTPKTLQMECDSGLD